MVALLCNFVLFCICGGQAHVVVSRKISSSPAHRGCFLEGPFIITQPLYVCGGGIIMQDKVLFSFLFAIYNYILERLLKQFQVTEETNINFTTILVFSRLLKQFQRKRRIEQASKQVIIIFAKETSSYVKGYNVSGGAHLRGLFSQPALCISRLTASRLLWSALCISRLSASRHCGAL